jgi:hypothetical protein
MSLLSGFPTGLLWKELLVTRAFFYINFRFLRNGTPLQVLFTEYQ